MILRLFLLLCLALPVSAETPLRVFAAASLGDALRDTGWDLRVSVAGSGTIARQIDQGAPADIVILANEAWMDWLVAQGAASDPIIIAGNRLVLVGTGALSDPRATLAMGDPRSVPAGRYAQQALVHRGKWAAIEPRVIRTADVRAALAFVLRGEVDLAVVYASDVQGRAVPIVETFAPASHDPIRYPAAILSAHPKAEAFVAWLISDAGQAHLARFGFAP